jgi:prepilin-type N-terminal cleavage/methylation domain-containing protein
MKKNGFSMAEMLIVIAFIGITVGIGIPMVNEQVRIAEIRGAADELAVHLRAARMMAVTRRSDVRVTVSVDPTNTISYVQWPTPTGVLPRLMTMPNRVKIVSGSTGLITFKSDGSTGSASTVTTESVVSTKTERWTLTVNIVGTVAVAHTRI